MKKIPRKSLKPRNGFVASALLRSSGAHGKTRKAERQAARMSLERTIRTGVALKEDGFHKRSNAFASANHLNAA